MASNLPKKNRTDQMLADQRLMDGLTKHAATEPRSSKGPFAAGLRWHGTSGPIFLSHCCRFPPR
jgi:hypothetical protein